LDFFNLFFVSFAGRGRGGNDIFSSNENISPFFPQTYLFLIEPLCVCRIQNWASRLWLKTACKGETLAANAAVWRLWFSRPLQDEGFDLPQAQTSNYKKERFA
jgi:hypothetical protein